MPATLWSKLQARAIELRSDQTALPIRLGAICENLRIEISRSSVVRRGNAYLRWDQEAGERPTVLLPITGVSTWDRFCIAHEIAHFVLISHFDWHPEGGARYWDTEALCDAFARELLIPTELIESAPIASRSARAAMDYCGLAARTARVPWLQAAKRISLIEPRLLFMRLEHGRGGDLKVTGTSHPGELGIGIKVPERSDLSHIVADTLKTAHTHYSPERRELDRRAFIGTSLGGLFSKLAVREAFLESMVWVKAIKLAAVR